MTRRTIDNVAVWDGNRVFPRGSIHIDGERIAAVGAAPCAPDGFVADERVDGEGKLALPGLINAHTHLYSSLARGMAVPGYAPTSFTEILEQLWWRLDKALDPSLVRTSALVGAMEAARCGVTTLIDHHASPRAIPGSLDVLREEISDRVGLRAALCYELSDRDGPAATDAGIEENLRFLREVGPTTPRAAASFGLHASFTISDDTLDRVAERLPDGAGIHIHVAEGPEDETSCETAHAMRVIERLDRRGLLRPNSLLVHCLHVDEEEKDRIAERGAIVVHNPRSNMNNAVGSFDLDGFLGRDVLTGLGTDGLGANLLGELFAVALAQKHTRGDSLAAGFPQLHRLLFTNNPAIAGRLFGIPFGRIEPGAPADLALIAYEPPTPLSSETLLGHLLFGVAVHSLRVVDLFVGGRPVLRDGRFPEIDERAAYAASREEAARLWTRIA